ncbi:MAG: hypothetical protein P0S95_01785 [Rhabdochlamydiaceae bacterium]|nr:hypothetical protein [Candidatus Amphrikana amoebophyrae]
MTGLTLTGIANNIKVTFAGLRDQGVKKTVVEVGTKVVDTHGNWSCAGPGVALLVRAFKSDSIFKAVISSLFVGGFNALVVNFAKQKDIDISAKLAFNVYSITGLMFSGDTTAKRLASFVGGSVFAVATGAMYYFNPRNYSAMKSTVSIVVGVFSGIALNLINPK